MKTAQRIFILTLTQILIFQSVYIAFFTPLSSRFSTYSATFMQNSTVYAEEEKWARILNDSTPFYADYACTIIKFYLPKTYFIKVVNTGEDVTRVIYMDNDTTLPLREGYVKTCDIFLFDGIPKSPYPQVLITVNSDEILFADSNKQYPKTVLTAGSTAVYYGALTQGTEHFYYVYSNGYIGYVRKGAFAPFEIPAHEIPLETPKDSSLLDNPLNSQLTSDTTTQVMNVDATMKIIITIAVALVSVSVIYLLFRPKNTSSRLVAFHDDEDF